MLLLLLAPAGTLAPPCQRTQNPAALLLLPLLQALAGSASGCSQPASHLVAGWHPGLDLVHALEASAGAVDAAARSLVAVVLSVAITAAPAGRPPHAHQTRCCQAPGSGSAHPFKHMSLWRTAQFTHTHHTSARHHSNQSASSSGSATAAAPQQPARAPPAQVVVPLPEPAVVAALECHQVVVASLVQSLQGVQGVALAVAAANQQGGLLVWELAGKLLDEGSVGLLDDDLRGGQAGACEQAE
jgi:hypothetical protein